MADGLAEYSWCVISEEDYPNIIPFHCSVFQKKKEISADIQRELVASATETSTLAKILKKTVNEEKSAATID